MNIKRKNHTVTRGYLANWKGADGNANTGIWYYDIASKAVKFSPGVKAPFAIRTDIYAPIYIDTNRDDRLENWLAESESQLCEFTRNFGSSRPKRVKPRLIKKALESIVGSSLRSEFSIEKTENYFRGMFPLESAENIKLRALNNLYSASHNLASEFIGGLAMIVEVDTPTFATNDQPFWNMSPRTGNTPMAVFPLSPKKLLVLLPSQPIAGGDMHFQFVKGDDVPAIVEFGKLGALRMARRWVVCSSQSEAEAAATYLTDEVIEEAWATDRLLAYNAESQRQIFSI